MNIIIVLSLLVSVILTSTVTAVENLPLYNLSVSLDISKNLLSGISTITIPENMVMNIFTGDLRISSVKLNGLPLSPGIKDGIFKVKGKGTLEISFNGRFGEINGTQNPDSIDENIGNYVLFPKSLSLLPIPQLGIFPSESGGRVKITNVESDSVAQKAGLKKDDLFISIDDWKIETIDDVRISIFDKKQGDTIKVKVLRKSLCWRERA